jgi:preprotein translocase subunit SecA
MITSSIERAQKKVEENNFGIRKRLLEYDDVMNSQREVVYRRRRNALYGDRLAVDIATMVFEACESIIEEHQDLRDFEGFRLEVIRVFSMDTAISQEVFFKEKIDGLTDNLYNEVMSFYRRKSEHIAQMALPVITQVYEGQGHQYENILIPITDGIKTIQVLVNLKKAVDSKGREVVHALEKMITLAMIDDAWKEHLREMDELKQSVQNAVYEQKDPLLIYKLESFNLFKQMLGDVGKEITQFLMKGNLPTQTQEQPQATLAPKAAPVVAPRPAPQLQTSRREVSEMINTNAEAQRSTPVKAEPKVGRNDSCPCGSGKKYKNCHGQGVEQ